MEATVTLLVLLATAAALLYAYATRHYGYWRKKGLPFLKPLPLVGSVKDVVLFRRHLGEVLKDIYESIKGQRYIGMFIFDQPVLFVRDLDLWKDIVHKDFEHFTDRGFTPNKHDVMFNEALFSRKGKHWKDLRVKMSPAFTTGKLKKFFALMEEKASNLDTFFDDVVDKGVPGNVMDACGRYTTDVVASVGFGLQCDSLKDDENEFRRLLKNIFVYNRRGALTSLAVFVAMPLAHWAGTTLVPPPLAAYLRRVIWQTVQERKSAGTVGQRHDFLDLLIELREKGFIADEDKAEAAAGAQTSSIYLDGDVFLAQALTFLSAGFETSSTTMSFALHELAMNQDIQDKLRSELQEAVELTGGKLTYDSLQAVKYLDNVMWETLRLYPILPFIDRTCTKAYRIPGTDVVLDKGTFVFTSLLGIHQDPEYWDEPERFMPERFADEAKQNRHKCALMPFGDGPRVCIGMRLGILQAKLGLAHLVLSYRLLPSELTPQKLELGTHSFLIQPQGGVNLLLNKLTPAA